MIFVMIFMMIFFQLNWTPVLASYPAPDYFVQLQYRSVNTYLSVHKEYYGPSAFMFILSYVMGLCKVDIVTLTLPLYN